MSNMDKRALKELYAKVEQQAHSLRGNPHEYQVLTGLCPVNVIEMHAQKIQALLDELEVATDACYGWQRKFAEADERLEAAEKRIGELEAKKVKIKLPESFYPDGDIDCPLVINEYQIIEAIVAADCKPIAVCPRCKCELDLSYKPDGAHYCHPAAAGKGEAS